MIDAYVLRKAFSSMGVTKLLGRIASIIERHASAKRLISYVGPFIERVHSIQCIGEFLSFTNITKTNMNMSRMRDHLYLAIAIDIIASAINSNDISSSLYVHLLRRMAKKFRHKCRNVGDRVRFNLLYLAEISRAQGNLETFYSTLAQYMTFRSSEDTIRGHHRSSKVGFCQAQILFDAAARQSRSFTSSNASGSEDSFRAISPIQMARSLITDDSFELPRTRRAAGGEATIASSIDDLLEENKKGSTCFRISLTHLVKMKTR